jgi:hypothetical protein
MAGGIGLFWAERKEAENKKINKEAMNLMC